MGTSLREVLRRIARTAALVAVLALLLFALVGWIAEQPGAEYALALGLSLPLALLSGWVVVEALLSGELPYRGGVDRRAQKPVAYWTGLAVIAASTVGLVALAVWCVARLMA